MRYYQGYGNIQEVRQVYHRLSHSLQFSLQRRFANGFSAGVNWNWVLMDEGNYQTNFRFEHVNGELRVRADQAKYDELNKSMGTPVHFLKGNFVWDLPDLHAGSGVAMTAVRNIINDWQLSGVWTAQTGGGYSLGFSYQSNGSNVNLTGSPDFGATIKYIGDPGSGCSSEQYKQFNTAAVTGPGYYSDGLESGRNNMRACWTSILDLALARNIRLGGARNVQLRLEAYNFLNTFQVTGRSTTIQYNSPTDLTVRNPQYNADGTLVESRLKPNAAGFGAATGWTGARTVQLQLRFSF